MEDLKNRFFNAIRNGETIMVKELIASDRSLVELRDNRGSTPLILATYYNQNDITGDLLDSGAKIDERDTSGNTALMGVCFKGFDEIAKMLIQSGADVNARNAMGVTCLIFAVTFRREKIAKLLIEHGADTQARDARGNTPLDHARMQGIVALINLLENPDN